MGRTQMVKVHMRSDIPSNLGNRCCRYIATVRKASAPGDEAVHRAASTNPFSMPAANLKGPYASPQSVQLSPSRGAMLDESSEFRMTARLSNINEHESAINSGTHSPMGSPVGSPFSGTQLWAAPAEDAASVGMAEPASTLFGCLKSPETSVQQVLVPVFAESDLEGVASHISALTGAKPRSSMPGDLHTFVCDWYRWQAHLERSNVSCARRGEPSRAASHECKQPGVPLGNRDSSAVRRPQTAPPAPRSTQVSCTFFLVGFVASSTLCGCHPSCADHGGMQVHEIEEEPEMTEKQLVEELLSSTREFAYSSWRPSHCPSQPLAALRLSLCLPEQGDANTQKVMGPKEVVKLN
ncbi:MAG: hypothetical protein SGPRY_011381 [Prymnesium sp.]